MEDLASFCSVSPFDGRYRDKVAMLAPMTSEAGLTRYRVAVECHWLLHLSSEPALKSALKLSDSVRQKLKELTQLQDLSALLSVKAIESETNHDVKAVEYFLQEELRAAGADENTIAYLHFACTSEDINNLAYGLMLKDVRERILVPAMDKLIHGLANMADQYAKVPMLSRTHGQSATPTTVGKEMAVFGHRLDRQRRQFCAVEILGKMNGAVGNFNAHRVAFPEVDWTAVAQRFVEMRLGLVYNPITTQIESHDGLAEYVDAWRRFHVIALGMCRDFWSYISLGYFRQKITGTEVGSSTMPHKVNPIDFENAEGNLGLAISMAQHFTEKLPVSRWQRDLSDSTVQRFFSHLCGHSLLAMNSMERGLSKCELAESVVREDLDDAWEVLAEPVQMVMRRHGMSQAYEDLKAATRGKQVSQSSLHAFIDSLDQITEEDRRRLRELTPQTYLGDAPRLAREFASKFLTLKNSLG